MSDAQAGAVPFHPEMTAVERVLANHVWEHLPETPAFEDYLEPVGDSEQPAYLIFPRQRRRVATRRATFLSGTYGIPDQFALALAAYQTGCNARWVATELDTQETRVHERTTEVLNYLGPAALTTNVPPCRVDAPLGGDVNALPWCPACGSTRLIPVETVIRSHSDPTPKLHQAIHTARLDNGRVCLWCYTPVSHTPAPPPSDAADTH